MMQRVWGPGFVLPGGAEFLMTLVTPLAVDSSMSLLDLSAGLGGSSRHVAKLFDVYVTALERVHELAERGQLMSHAAGLGKRVPIRRFDPETVELRQRSFDAVFAQFLMATVIGKERLIREVHRSLKARGQFAFVDFVVKDDAVEESKLQGLRHPAEGGLILWRMPQYVDCLNNAGFDCRTIEDQTAAFRAHVLRGWRDVLKDDEWRTRPRRELVALFEEAELWFRYLAAMEAGLIRVARIHAVAK
jgi:cyclopropane fatty-acyl-phospholipid synthase-like methyltransferase